MSDIGHAIPVISALIERQHNGKHELLLQTRAADYDTVYFGTFEIPAGRIDTGENIFDTVRREVAEETGYRVISIVGEDGVIKRYSSRSDCGQVFRPFCCQQLMEGNFPWVGFVFKCEVSFNVEHPIDNSARDHIWVSTVELSNLLKNRRDEIFTLQLPVLDYYLTTLNHIAHESDGRNT